MHGGHETRAAAAHDEGVVGVYVCAHAAPTSKVKMTYAPAEMRRKPAT